MWLIAVTIGFLSIICCNGSSRNHELPCHFFDSINISGGALQSDKSIRFGNTTFNENQYGLIDYVLDKESRPIPAEPHLRGCLCDIKPCIRLCCPYGSITVRTPGKGATCQQQESPIHHEKSLKVENANVKTLLENNHFEYVYDRPCNQLYLAIDYAITSTGDILFENELVSHRRYCLRTTLKNETKEPISAALICFEAGDKIEIRHSILPYGMLISVPFILATILVYICLPELRNLHGKCLLCYLIGLSVGYFFMALIQLNGRNFISPLICKPVGYLTYFSFMSAFLWLSVISFDLWWIFRSTHGVLVCTERKRFLMYMLYAWGVSLFLTIVVVTVDSIPSLESSDYRPSIGRGTCFLRRTLWSQFIYFYLPLIIICSINVTFFILTALRILRAQQDLKKVTCNEESTRHRNKLNTNKDSFTLYLRLFIVMGMTWVMEGISFVIDENSKFFILTDLTNSCQGILIFVLFVLKRRVLRLIKKRWHGYFGKATTNGSVATSHSTTATYAPSNISLNQITTPNDKPKGTD